MEKVRLSFRQVYLKWESVAGTQVVCRRLERRLVALKVSCRAVRFKLEHFGWCWCLYSGRKTEGLNKSEVDW